MYLCKVHPYITLVHNTCTLCMKVNVNFMGVEWYHEVKNVIFLGIEIYHESKGIDSKVKKMYHDFV
jgi:hypothetical protein